MGVNAKTTQGKAVGGKSNSGASRTGTKYKSDATGTQAAPSTHSATAGRSVVAKASDAAGSTEKPRADRSRQRRTERADGADRVAMLDAAVAAAQQAVAMLADATAHLQDDVGRVGAAAAGNAASAWEHAAKLFEHEVQRLLGDDPPDDAAVRRAARQTFAEQAWQRRLGSLLGPADVASVLGVSRQRVNTLVNDGRLIALTHDGHRRFPAWQFAGTNAGQRDCLARAHLELVDTGRLSPWSAASWFLTVHPDLDDRDPVGFLRDGGDAQRLLTAVRRDAARAAQ